MARCPASRKRNDMKRTLQLVVVVAGLVGVLGLGALAGGALGGMSSADPSPDQTTDATAPAPTTEPPATDAVTTTPEVTSDVTTTAPIPSAPTTTADTTPVPTTGGDQVTQSTPQTTPAPPTSPGGTTTAATQTQPCQTPTNPGVTCGNNAATQLAVVTQQCQSEANVSTSGLTIQIVNADGSIAKTTGIANESICLNYAAITQIVRQICVNCTLVVQNYYSKTVTEQTIVNGWTGPRYVGYCMPANRPVERGDGTVGWLVFLEQGRPGWDPQYRGATPAPFDGGAGYSCPGTASAAVPNTFTLTVPAAFIGQYINLCLQPTDPQAKPVCHSVQIDNSSKLTIPVSSNITATVTRTPKAKVVSLAHTNVGAALLAPKAKKHCVWKAKSARERETRPALCGKAARTGKGKGKR
jgi:hypothetical protein